MSPPLRFQALQGAQAIRKGQPVREVPQVFSTTSTLCIIANRGTTHEAIQSRAVTLCFDPTNREIHQAVARWYWDQEIHDWFGRHLSRLSPIDPRWYVIADRDKQAGRNWDQIVLTSHSRDRACCLVQDLEIDPSCPTRADKARRFVEMMGTAKGASRASYFRLRKRLEQQGQLVVDPVAPIRLRRRRRPGSPTQVEVDLLAVPAQQQPEDEPGTVDLPAHDAFERPIRGTAPVAQQPPPGPLADDTTAIDQWPVDSDDHDGTDDAA